MNVASPALPLMLARHVRACECEGQVILLDLRRSKYLAVGSAVAHALADRVQHWPVGADWPMKATAAAEQPKIDAFAERLATQDLLTSNTRDREGDPVIPEANASLDYGDFTGEPIPPSRIASFLFSAARAAWWLRLRSLHAIAGTLATRRARLNGDSCGSLEASKAASAMFVRLRPLVFTSHEKCLFDSLALMAFLASEGHFPRWVIGVKTNPFGAHSWVQQGTTVLNDQHEYVRRFRPILVV